LAQEEIYSSSYAAAAYLESIKFNKKVYVIGEEGIQQVGTSGRGGRM
jgi:phosphoglycolate phosphatase